MVTIILIIITIFYTFFTTNIIYITLSFWLNTYITLLHYITSVLLLRSYPNSLMRLGKLGEDLISLHLRRVTRKGRKPLQEEKQRRGLMMESYVVQNKISLIIFEKNNE